MDGAVECGIQLRSILGVRLGHQLASARQSERRYNDSNQLAYLYGQLTNTVIDNKRAKINSCQVKFQNFSRAHTTAL